MIMRLAIVPAFDGYYSAINGRTRYGTSTSRERPHDSGGASSNPTESRKPDHSGQTARDQPQNGGQVEEANVCPQSPHRPQEFQVHHIVD